MSDRGQVRGLARPGAEEFPLRAVVHAAGVLDDGVIGSLRRSVWRGVGAEGRRGVASARVDEGMDLERLCCSRRRRACWAPRGRVTTRPRTRSWTRWRSTAGAGVGGASLAWGLWAQESEADGWAGRGGQARMERCGSLALADEEGLELFDRACGRRPRAAGGRALGSCGAGSLARSGGSCRRCFAVWCACLRGGRWWRLSGARLAGVAEEEREGVVLELVRGEVAAVLGHASAAGGGS